VSPDCAIHSRGTKGNGGAGTQTPRPQAPERAFASHARAVRVHDQAGMYEVACGGHAPPSTSLVAMAAPAAAQTVLVHGPTEAYVPQELPPGQPPKNIWTVGAPQCAFAGLPHEQPQVGGGALGSAWPSNATVANVVGQGGAGGPGLPV
jgi:hypothetical protein